MITIDDVQVLEAGKVIFFGDETAVVSSVLGDLTFFVGGSEGNPHVMISHGQRGIQLEIFGLRSRDTYVQHFGGSTKSGQAYEGLVIAQRLIELGERVVYGVDYQFRNGK